MEETIQHKIIKDSTGKLLDGARNYRQHLFNEIPSCAYWSVIVYDTDTNLIIKSDQLWPSVHSKSKNLVVNQDGSVDVFFGPEKPEEKRVNWIKTLPGKSWFVVCRIYITLCPGFNTTWLPGDLELIN